jgi:hypothetical protein
VTFQRNRIDLSHVCVYFAVIFAQLWLSHQYVRRRFHGISLCSRQLEDNEDFEFDESEDESHVDLENKYYHAKCTTLVNPCLLCQPSNYPTPLSLLLNSNPSLKWSLNAANGTLYYLIKGDSRHSNNCSNYPIQY